MKKLLKSLLMISAVVAVTGAATGAYFTSSVTAANNLITVGTLRLAIDSSRNHAVAYTWNGGTSSWGAPFDSYVVAYDANGVSTNLNTLEPWQNAEPGAAVAYTNQAGADVMPAGNKSWFISFRNIGTIDMNVSANISGGTWTADPNVTAANGTCTDAYLNANNPLSVNNVTFYGRTSDGSTPNICKSHEECENIYFGLTGLGAGWTYATSANANIDHSFVPSATVRVSTDGTNTPANAITLKSKEFILARVDASFNTSDNCFQGATYTYSLNGNAYQVADGSW